MIDWFVLLIPLVLLPILALFVFVGCPLDRSGSRSAPIRFSYVGDYSDVQSIEATFTFTPSKTEGSEFPHSVGVIPLTGDQVKPGGETDLPDGTLSLPDIGTLKCSCKITKKVSGEQLTPELDKDKEEDEDPPSFTLVRDGGAFAFHIE